ncbi:MAG: LptA/OstA family protein [Pseudomonadota bacterium]
MTVRTRNKDLIRTRSTRTIGVRTACALLARSVFLAAVSAAPAAAQLAAADDCDEPLDVGGDRLEVVDEVATLTGNVRLVQCDAVLSTTTLVTTQGDGGSYDTMKASGAVRYVSGEDAVASREAVYDRGRRTITFTGDVIVTQGRQVMTGSRLVYHVDDGRIEFSAAPGERVRGVIYTQSLEAPA